MKIALIHDYLNQYGGAERVLEALMEIFPEAPVYTLFYDKEKTLGRFEGRIKKTSFLDFPLVSKNHRFFIPLMPAAANFLQLDSEYDLIISSSAGFGKGISIIPNFQFPIPKLPRHIAYIHTPLRYAWEPHYINLKFKNQKSKLRNIFLNPILSYLKHWDYRAGQKPDVLIANSNYIAGKIKDYYGREAEVVYPPVDTTRFFYEKKSGIPNYYLAVGRMLPYKRFDLVIDAFAKLSLPLKIVGSGPEEKKLKAKSSKLKADNIEFLLFVDDDELRRLYSGAKALIFPQIEDFGLVAAEAQACGCPVIAFGEGGAREIVKDGITGVLFHNQTADALAGAVKKFQTLSFDKKVIQKSAQRFSKENFKKRILALAKSV
jgi:glycosyltransferase involved in cell wall biosynthesis